MDKKRPRLTAAVLVQKDDKFLLAQRNKKNAHGLWVIPGGGVEFGETIRDAALREIKEETNLDVEIVSFIGYDEVINVPAEYHAVVHFFLAKPLHEDVQIQTGTVDVADARFFTLDEIKGLETVQSVKWAFEKAGLWR